MRPYFDINCRIGRMSAQNPHFPYTKESLLDDLNYYKISAAAVLNNISLEYSYVLGNIEAIKMQSPRIYPIATVCTASKFEAGEQYFNDLVDSGVKGFYFSPKITKEPFSLFFIKEIADYIQQQNLPVLIDASEVTIDSLIDILSAFPKLNIVLLNPHRTLNRTLLLMMSKFNNLWFEISNCQTNDFLLQFDKITGLERVLFGTGYPYKSPGAIKSLVEYSSISENKKNLVAYKNACGLLGIDEKQLLLNFECQLDSIAKAADSGKPLSDIIVIDAHIHMIDKSHKTTTSEMRLYLDEDSIIRKMDRLGIDIALVSPFEGVYTNGITANNTAIKAKENYPNRFEIYACANPNYKEDLKEIIPQHEKHDFLGIKPYWYAHKTDLLSDKYQSWFKYANTHHLLCLIHGQDNITAEKTAQLALQYPNATFILAHSGKNYELAQKHIEVAKAISNIYLEISFTTLTYGIIEYLVNSVGADKIIFGTDTGVGDPASYLGWVAYAKISEQAKKKILGENIKKIIDKIKLQKTDTV